MLIIDTNSNCTNKVNVLLARGVSAVGRYYRIKHLEWRLTPAEARKLSSKGIAIFVVYEDTGHKLNLTDSQGHTDGTNALTQARGVGQPPGTAIYFAVEGLPDGYRSADLPAIRNYFAGIKGAIGSAYELGVYSDGVVCDALLREGTCKFAWLSASTAFEGSKAFYRSDRWHLAQKTPVNQNWDGLSVDVNEGKAEFGAFSVPIA